LQTARCMRGICPYVLAHQTVTTPGGHGLDGSPGRTEHERELRDGQETGVAPERATTSAGRPQVLSDTCGHGDRQLIRCARNARRSCTAQTAIATLHRLGRGWPTRSHSARRAENRESGGRFGAMRRRRAYRLYVAGRLFLRPSELASYPRERLSKVRLGTVRVAKGWIENGFHESLRHVVARVSRLRGSIQTQDPNHHVKVRVAAST
jgi:hypothetical protein